MKLFVWRYECADCGNSYALPGADLSFFYGTFLAVSASGVAAIYEAIGDATFGEVRTMIDSDRRVLDLPEPERIALLHDVLSVTFDFDAFGWPFVITGSPGCPRCRSRSVRWFEGTSEPAGTVETQVTRTVWTGFTGSDREARVSVALAEALGRQRRAAS